MNVSRAARRAVTLAAASVLSAGALVAIGAHPAAAAPFTNHMTATASAYNAQGDSSRYPTSGPLTNAAHGGNYLLQGNLWNKAVTGSLTVDYAGGSSTAWQISGNTANSHFFLRPGGGPNPDREPPVVDGAGSSTYTCTDNGNLPAFDPNDPICEWAGHGDPWRNPVTGQRDPVATTGKLEPYVPQQPTDGNPALHVTGTSNEFSNQIHAPASYAHIMMGCHWGTCTAGATPFQTDGGGPFPIQYRQLDSLMTNWQRFGDNPLNALYDASYDIWLDSNTRNCAVSGARCANPPRTPVLPTHPASLGTGNPYVGQNDGAEVMIWLGNSGYHVTPAGQMPVNGTITPVGKQVNLDRFGNVTPLRIGSIGGLFDVWAGRARSFDNGVRWNVVTFVARTNATQLGDTRSLSGVGFDAKQFLDYAAQLGNVCDVDTMHTPLTSDLTTCVDPSWWITSVQAGYEIWELPSGTFLGTNDFWVQPIERRVMLRNAGTRNFLRSVTLPDTSHALVSDTPNAEVPSTDPLRTPDEAALAEHFRVIDNSDGSTDDDSTVSLIADSTSQIMSAATNPINLGARSIGNTEKFHVLHSQDGTISLQSLLPGPAPGSPNGFVTAINFDLAASAFTSPGPFEKFTVTMGDVSILSPVFGTYVTAANGGASSLIANQTMIGPEQTFRVVFNSDATISLLAFADNRYVTAENAGASALIANRTAIGLWEKFSVTHTTDPDGRIVLTAMANNRLVNAQNTQTALIANQTLVADSDKFRMSFIPSGAAFPVPRL
jgi:hypothetical protein